MLLDFASVAWVESRLQLLDQAVMPAKRLEFDFVDVIAVLDRVGAEPVFQSVDSAPSSCEPYRSDRPRSAGDSGYASRIPAGGGSATLHRMRGRSGLLRTARQSGQRPGPDADGPRARELAMDDGGQDRVGARAHPRHQRAARLAPPHPQCRAETCRVNKTQGVTKALLRGLIQ
jgi:hypothetical protein